MRLKLNTFRKTTTKITMKTYICCDTVELLPNGEELSCTTCDTMKYNFCLASGALGKTKPTASASI